MNLTAVKDLPNGIKAGTAFTDSEIRGRLLVTLGLAREQAPEPQPEPSRRRYRRRDLQAEDGTDVVVPTMITPGERVLSQREQDERPEKKDTEA